MNNATATIEMLPNTIVNGRSVCRALVELSAHTGEWLGSFVVFGRDHQAINDLAYMEANINLSSKGYALQYMRRAAA